MSSRVNRQILLRSRPSGMPTADNFKLVETPVADPGPGEFLCRTEYLSLDPYMRYRMDTEPLGRVMIGGTVSRIVESRNADFPVGDFVLGSDGWQEYAISNGVHRRKLDPSQAPVSYALGVLGMPGMTAYVALLDAGRPKPGETVVISAASGAVGSVAGQIARIKDCRVVGVTGSQAKCDYVVRELGFAACVNHRSDDLNDALVAACPDGIDIYFDNVGGRVLDAVLNHLNLHARVALVGMISQYGAATPPPGPNLWRLLNKRASIQGFSVTEHTSRSAEFRADVERWLKEGAIKYREDVVEGLENAPSAFRGLLEGKNFGKMLIKVS